jgi:hypothetical protein
MTRQRDVRDSYEGIVRIAIANLSLVPATSCSEHARKALAYERLLRNRITDHELLSKTSETELTRQVTDLMNHELSLASRSAVAQQSASGC